MITPQVVVNATVTADGAPAHTATAVLTVTTSSTPWLASPPNLPFSNAASALLSTGLTTSTGQLGLAPVTQDPNVAGQSSPKLIRLTGLADGAASSFARQRLSLLVGVESGWLALLLLSGTVALTRIRTVRSARRGLRPPA